MSENKTTGFLRRDVLQGTAIAGLATLAPIKNLAAAPSETNEALAPQPTPVPGNELNTSDILVETLIDWGATHVFGSRAAAFGHRGSGQIGSEPEIKPTLGVGPLAFSSRSEHRPLLFKKSRGLSPFRRSDLI